MASAQKDKIRRSIEINGDFLKIKRNLFWVLTQKKLGSMREFSLFGRINFLFSENSNFNKQIEWEGGMKTRQFKLQVT